MVMSGIKGNDKVKITIIKIVTCKNFYLQASIFKFIWIHEFSNENCVYQEKKNSLNTTNFQRN